MSVASERVAAGAAWLDERLPSWSENIDLDNLQMYDACQCVLGQTIRGIALKAYDGEGSTDANGAFKVDGMSSSVSGYAALVDAPYGLNDSEFKDVINILDLSINQATAVAYGFNHDEQTNFTELEEEWGKVIEKRQS